MRAERLALAALAGLLLVAAGFGWSRSELVAPPPSLMLLDRHGAFLAQTGGGEGTGWGYWPVEPIPERVAAAILAIEDRRFAAHPGIDPLAAARAIGERLTGSGRSGASTIAMQVARMQTPGRRTLPRKLAESVTAAMLVLRHGREAVLRHYLRLVPFGNGSHGIAHAARWYLDKPVGDLSWAEIAFLAAIPQAPGRMNPFLAAGRARAVQRGHRILAHLCASGVIDAHEFALAEWQIEALRIPDRSSRPTEALHAILRLEKALTGTGRWGVVTTALDLDAQRRIQAIAHRHLDDWRRRGAEQVAAVVVERTTRRVVAWVGSANYFSPAAGAIDFTAVIRSPGSALKPFIFALALDRGAITANTVLADLPEAQWGIDNADRNWLGPMLPRQALATSRNVPAAVVLRRTGLDETHLFLADLGLHDNSRSAARYGLVLAVGALPTTLERLLRAYGALADDGRLLDLEWWGGQERPPAIRILSPNTARQVTLFLSDPAARLPTFPRLGATADGMPIAIKTGTSQGYRDAWAVAWTSDYLVGVWTGRARGTSMRAVTGASSSAQLAQDILVDLQGERPPAGFPPPDGWRAVELCAQTGLRSAGRCTQSLSEWFAEGRTPEEDEVFQLARIDLRNGLLAAPWTPARYTAERTFATLPADQAAWGKANQLPPPPTELSPLDRPGIRTPSRPSAMPATGLRVLAPRDGLRMVRNPETPPEANRLNLRAAAGPEVKRVLWLVDRRPWRVADPREPVAWTMAPGIHRFELATEDGTVISPAATVHVE
ncbi:MAG: transglycosylase domain-containing protein [Magnetospirillum sp.]|nr:transglycosylase domain-containing protein [Magnetospirillum sp.]